MRGSALALSVREEFSAEVRRRVYDGQCVVFRNVPAMRRLAARFREDILPMFESGEVGNEELCMQFEKGRPEMQELFLESMRSIGAVEGLRWDRIRLRIQEGTVCDNVSDVKYSFLITIDLEHVLPSVPAISRTREVH